MTERGSQTVTCPPSGKHRNREPWEPPQQFSVITATRLDQQARGDPRRACGPGAQDSGRSEPRTGSHLGPGYVLSPSGRSAQLVEAHCSRVVLAADGCAVSRPLEAEFPSASDAAGAGLQLPSAAGTLLTLDPPVPGPGHTESLTPQRGAGTPQRVRTAVWMCAPCCARCRAFCPDTHRRRSPKGPGQTCVPAGPPPYRACSAGEERRCPKDPHPFKEVVNVFECTCHTNKGSSQTSKLLPKRSMYIFTHTRVLRCCMDRLWASEERAAFPETNAWTFLRLGIQPLCLVCCCLCQGWWQ